MDSFAWALVSDQTDELAGGNAVSDARGRVLLPPMLGFQPPSPAGLEHENFPGESGLVQRVVRSSCFGAGNGAATRAGHHAKVAGDGGGGSDNDNAEPEVGGVQKPNAEAAAGVCSSRGPEPDCKKRKRSNEDVPATDQAEPDASTYSPNGSERSSSARGDQNGPAAAAKRKGKGVTEAAGEPPKEGYIHVRARKGQATNNHSLAERLRREKINERMKLLQDLVPGCSKITGKSVMLDEIINYVQSLQRQVEFLSMKLATVNPQLGLGIEGLLSKDLFRFPGGAPSSSAPIGLSFYQEMIPKLPLMSESGMLQGVHGMGNSNVFRTVMQEQLHEKEYREHGSQMPHNLDGSFHHTGPLVYRSATSLELLSIKPDQDGFHI